MPGRSAEAVWAANPQAPITSRRAEIDGVKK
jgi:hypothetical protein